MFSVLKAKYPLPPPPNTQSYHGSQATTTWGRGRCCPEKVDCVSLAVLSAEHVSSQFNLSITPLLWLQNAGQQEDKTEPGSHRQQVGRTRFQPAWCLRQEACPPHTPALLLLPGATRVLTWQLVCVCMCVCVCGRFLNESLNVLHWNKEGREQAVRDQQSPPKRFQGLQHEEA